MVSIVAPGPYIGDLSSELRTKDSAEILQEARNSLEGISSFKAAADFLRKQIDSLAENTSNEIKYIPNFRELHNGEHGLSKFTDHRETPKLLQAIKLIRQAFSLQRLLHQTREITATEQMNFAKLLNQRIDPIDEDGVRGKERPQPTKFKAFQESLSALAIPILKVPSMLLVQSKKKLEEFNAEFKRDFDIKRVADKLYAALRVELGTFTKSFNTTQVPPDQNIKRVILSIAGGLENAMSQHLAFVKVAFEKLKDRIPDTNSSVFREAWTNVLANLSHISKQLSTVQAFTLKLVENLNANKSNQKEAHHFDPKNFELVSSEGKLVLLPTLEFLQKVITQANDNSTMIQSVHDVRPGKNEVNFAKEYFFPQGCPIHGAKGDLNSEKFNLAEKYFDVMDLITKAVFGYQSPGLH